ncbi:MAG: sporulation protein, partial [Candidatus Eremiobacteraeota bacterium]|nr:sporulation protein [Candidatus Eremiobacteraeota bacterium]
MIGRALFLKGLGAATTIATGGLDVWDPLSPQIRVLVAADLRGETPQVAADGTFAFGGKRWRGAPSTVGTPDGKMMLVTTIDVDQYLQGVVPLEAPASWPAAALEAQAIVARTYALARRSLSRPWDVRADDSDQHWGGVDAEHPASTAAVQASRGRTVTFGGGPASVFYSACCGGHTADVTAVWNGAPMAYLRGVEDPNCGPAPEYRWSRTVGLDRAVAAFGARTGGSVIGTALTEADPTGRPRGVALLGSTVATIPVADFRRGLGYDVVRSLWLRAVRIDATQAAPR